MTKRNMTKRNWMAVLSVLSLTAVLASCASSSKEPRNFSNISLPPMEGVSCVVHQDCSAGSACMHSVCVNMDHVACSTDLNCPEYEKCYDGVCKACGADADCGMNFQCNASGVCVPKGIGLLHCDSVTDCQNGEVCFNGICAGFCYGSEIENNAECLSQNKLYVGLALNVTKCEVYSSRLDDPEDYASSCINGGKCVNNACYEMQCTEDSQCGDSSICSQGKCLKVQCMKDDDCWDEGRCIDHICQQCVQDDECSDGKKCLIEKHYSMISYKLDGSMNGKGPEEGKTKKCLECTDNSHCGGDRPFCNLESFECVACHDYGGCKDGLVCRDGLCKPECTEDDDCKSGKCIDQVCYECMDDDDCNGWSGNHCKLVTHSHGYSCVGQKCEYNQLSKAKNKCVECGDDSDCKDGNICSGAGECVECFAGRGCTDGYVCVGDTCREKKDEKETAKKEGSAPSKCEKQTDCENGYFCSYENKCKPVAVKCSTDAECGEKGHCNRYGYCKAAQKLVMGFVLYSMCEEDEQCQHMGGAQCNPIPKKTMKSDGYETMARRCEYLCKTDADCENGETCLSGACIKDEKRHYCLEDEHCAEGYRCNTLYHECVADKSVSTKMNEKEAIETAFSLIAEPELAKIPNMCWRDSDCTDGLLCLNGTCGCMFSSDCRAGQKCTDKHVCECSSDEGCGDGYFCKIAKMSFDPNSCRCLNDEACGMGQLCNEDGDCVSDEEAENVYQNAVNYHYGMTRLVDLQKAIELYKKADQMGHVAALLQLGMLYYDHMEEHADYRQKAEDAIRKGLAKIEEAKEAPTKTEPNIAKSSPLYKMYKLMENSFKMNKNDIEIAKARLMLDGFVLEKNEEEAFKILNSLTENDDYIAYYEWARYYVKHKKYRSAVSVISKRNYYGGYYSNARTGYGMSQMAKMMATQMPVKWQQLSIEDYLTRYFKVAAEMGNPDAAYQYAGFRYLENGPWLASEEQMLSMAAKRGHQAAASRLASLKANAEQIEKLRKDGDYLAASELGDIQSCIKYLYEEQARNRSRKSRKREVASCVDTLINDGMLIGYYLKHKYIESDFELAEDDGIIYGFDSDANEVDDIKDERDAVISRRRAHRMDDDELMQYEEDLAKEQAEREAVERAMREEVERAEAEAQASDDQKNAKKSIKPDIALLRKAIDDINKKFKKCGKDGTLTFSFNLADHKASNVKVFNGSYKNTPAEYCIIQIIKKYEWPDGEAKNIKFTVKN